MDDLTDDKALASLLASVETGDPLATDQLFTALYNELRRMAARQLHGANAAGLSLGATTLLHEAYADLSRRMTQFPDRPRFFAYAARAMRGLIIDALRNRRAVKRGGQFHLMPLDTDVAESVKAEELGPLSDALDALQATDPALAELVDLKYFCGFGFAEIAAMRGVSERTVQRDWAKARLFLHDALKDE